MDLIVIFFGTHQIEALPTSSAVNGFKADVVFKEIEKKLEEEGEQFVKKIGGIFAFKVKDGPEGKEATWVVDVKNGKGSVLLNSGQYSDDFVYRNTDKYTRGNVDLLWCFPRGLASEV
ncbi:hypothetical protein GH733_015333 [Mirounga leonina]|nr:hypothetical protein GH733_015333 [Mirounga leonina]